jgi:ankyrin repeat protein
MVNVLLKTGSNPNVISSEGSVPIYVAAQLGNDDVVTALIKAGADIEFTFNDGYTYVTNQKSRDKFFFCFCLTTN